MILHDSHAEVLARRGLLKIFWMEIRILLQQYLSETVLRRKEKEDKEVGLDRETCFQQKQQKNNLEGMEFHNEEEDGELVQDSKFLLNMVRNEVDECASTDASTSTGGEEGPKKNLPSISFCIKGKHKSSFVY